MNVQSLIIDSHTHAWLPEDLAILERGLRLLDTPSQGADTPYNWTPRFKGTLENLLAVEAEAGIDRFVLLPVSSQPGHCQELTRWVAAAANEHPAIIPFGSVHPYSETLADDVAAIKDLGLAGVKLHSLVQRFDPLSPEAEATYGLLEKEGLVLLMDSMNLDGAAACKPNLAPLMALANEFHVETGPEQIAAIARRHPGLTIIAAHLGCCYGWEWLDPIQDLDQVYYDLAYVHRLVTPSQALAIIRRKGADRIIFGTDAPYRWPKKALKWFYSLGLTPEEQKNILSANLGQLLKLDIGV